MFEIDGSRVADASVTPSIVRGNTNAAVIAIPEKAADIVLESIRSMTVAPANRSDRQDTTGVKPGVEEVPCSTSSAC